MFFQELPLGTEPAISEVNLLTRAWLDNADKPCAIVDQDLWLHWANSAAEIAFDGRSVLERRNNRLTTVESAHQAGFHSFVRAAKTVRSTWCFPCTGGHMLVRGSQINRTHNKRYIGMEFVTTLGFEPGYADLEHAFHLTAQERRVLEALLTSQPPAEIARQLGLRVATVRTHVRNVYEKLDVTCREALFHRVAPFRVV